MESLFLILILLVTSLSGLFLYAVNRSSGGGWRGPKPCAGKDGVPPGTLGLPLLGETMRLISAYKTSDPEPFIDQRVARFGSVFTSHLFGEATIFSTDAEVNRFILQNEGKLFVGDYPRSLTELLGKHSLVLMKGNHHKRMHSLTTSFANYSFIKDHLFSHIQGLVHHNLRSWGQHATILLQDEAKKITFDLTVKQLMSLNPGEWTEKVREEYLRLIEGFFSVPIPLPFTTYARALKARSMVAAAVKSKVNERRLEFMQTGERRRKDMMEALLEEGLSDEEIVDFILQLLVAGYETTSIIMTLSVKFLSQNSNALAELKEEHEQIRRRKGTGEELDWSDYKSISFTQCVINETMRLANVVSGVFRRAVCDVHFKGHTIPKGWKVFASFRGVHMDQHLYQDARKFNPWRWQSNDHGPIGGGSTKSNGASIFTPFGGGPRLCPGYELARVEICIFLHHLVTTFSWEEADPDRLVFFPTTRTLKRYPIKVKRIS